MSLSGTDSNVRNKNLENPQLNPYKNFSSKTRDTKILQTQKSSETKSSLHLPALLYLTTPPVPLNRMSIGGGNRSQEFDRIVGNYFNCNLCATVLESVTQWGSTNAWQVKRVCVTHLSAI